ncbi:hypothetical protein [Comamonas testosteroni]|uniref:hypothetical protein n=1 Tax=Comamonas testosteroni TaxID=285 RepID=UPI0026EE7663|nr:hypothetical protein [Comamonas testosteroni]
MKRMKKSVLALAVVATALTGCSNSEPMTGDKVIAALKAANISVSNVQKPARDPSSPMPNSYSDRVSFALPSVAPKGGQVFVCDKKEYCDAIFTYFDALKALAGPYLFRSKDGLVVAQLNSGLQPTDVEPVRKVIESLK